MYIYNLYIIYIYKYIYPIPPMSRMRHKVNFRVFLLLNWLLCQG